MESKMNPVLKKAFADLFSKMMEEKETGRHIEALCCIMMLHEPTVGYIVVDWTGLIPAPYREAWDQLINASETYDEERCWQVWCGWHVEGNTLIPGPAEWSFDALAWAIGEALAQLGSEQEGRMYAHDLPLFTHEIGEALTRVRSVEVGEVEA